MLERVRRLWWRAWREVAGVGSVIALAAGYLSPALKDGGRFGGFDFVIPLTSLGQGSYRHPAFNTLNSDVVSQMNAWNLLDWRQVHAGHFPLWNDLSLLGLPHFLNFESAVLSLPDLVSYTVPIQYAFLVAVFMKLLIAGTGAYLLSRLVGLGPLGASFAGISFMLSGAFANWLTWPLSDVVAWLGWIAAFAILAYRFPGRSRYIVGLGVSVGFCLYGGFPEANIFVALSLVVLVVFFLVARVSAGRRHRNEKGLSVGGLGRVGVGVVAGGLLAMPLLWPGVQVLGLAHRTTESGFPGLPAKSLSLLLAQGYYGLPTGKNPFFLTGSNYYESVSYLGVVMIVLALVALTRWWHHPTVLALGGLSLVALLVAYQTASFHPVQQLLNSVASEVEWLRFRSVLGLPAGILGGLGLETVVRRWRSEAAFALFAAASVLLSVCVIVLERSHVAEAAAAHVRARSLFWPEGLVVLCLLCALVWGTALFLEGQRGAHAHSSFGPRLMALVVGGL
ncbi:MAG: hypothetical protein ACYDBS_06980, partial [Acidimicrobiales bacterium]